MAADGAERLLTLGQLDTEADQLAVRRERLPERAEMVTRSGQLAEWERRRSAMEARIGELGEAMEAVEARASVLRADRQRLQTQLRRVIVVREAEALMHEIAAADEALADLDERELADLTEQAATEEALADHLQDEAALRSALGQADAALGVAVGDIDRQLADIDTRRTALRGAIDPAILSSYDRIRGQLGVAVARLVGHRCEGCHLDLSAAEVDIAKDEAGATGFTDCPHCGRMLVVLPPTAAPVPLAPDR